MSSRTHSFFVTVCTLAAVVSTQCAAIAGEGAPWQNLFDGRSLDGWIQRNGTARFTVEDGAIVGTTVVGSPNSFLCTARDYGDFILELDFKVDEGLNSGVQIRSQSLKDYKGGRVHGYQVEIDPAQKELYSTPPPNLRSNGVEIPAGREPRRWTGGIYDEARRGWLCNLTRNEVARRAYKPDEWNRFRIEAKGDSIRTWINGVPAASIVDSMTPNGFFALQVHATAQEEPMQVRWKNIRIQDLGPNPAQPDPAHPHLGDWEADRADYRVQVFHNEEGGYRANLLDPSDREPVVIAVLEGAPSEDPILLAGGDWSGKIENGRLQLIQGDTTVSLRRTAQTSPTLNAPPPPGAIVLFDGSNVDAWASQKPKEWEVADGPADDWKLVPGGRLEAVPEAGSIITKQTFGDCRLHVEFRTLGAVNSGVYLQARYEIGVKDSYGQTQGSPCGAPGNFSGDGTQTTIPNAAYPPFQWQTLDVDFRAPRFDQSGMEKRENAKLTVALNGVQLYENFEVTKIKGAAKRLGEAPRGPLMLQEHGAPIQFRNVWIIDQPR